MQWGPSLPPQRPMCQCAGIQYAVLYGRFLCNTACMHRKTISQYRFTTYIRIHHIYIYIYTYIHLASANIYSNIYIYIFVYIYISIWIYIYIYTHYMPICIYIHRYTYTHLYFILLHFCDIVLHRAKALTIHSLSFGSFPFGQVLVWSSGYPSGYSSYSNKVYDSSDTLIKWYTLLVASSQ